MITKLGFQIIRSERSFRHYIKHGISYTRYYYGSYPTRVVHEDDEFEKIASCIKLIELDDNFNALLTEGEKEAIQYYNYHNPDTAKPENLELNLTTAYEKWLTIFFDDRSYLYGELNPESLGKLLRYIRESADVKKTELADMLGVNRITIKQIEDGLRLPSLTYLYRFLKVFNITLDQVLTLFEIVIDSTGALWYYLFKIISS